MKMTHFIAAALLMVATPFAAFAGRGIEGGNGGSIVIDGKTYQIADLHFVPQEFGQYQFDPELKAKLESFRDLLYKHFFGTQIALYQDRESNELFEREIFNPLVEYRLVSKLPSDCVFISQENLPLVKSTVAVACTKGKLTFILPDYFAKLDLQQKALLIVHERMHALFPSEPYELKVDVIKALYVLTGRYQAALEAKDTSFQFTDEEYDTVRILPYRLNQLYGIEQVKWSITREGGIASQIQGDDIHLDITSQVTNGVQGKNIWVKGSRVEGGIQGQNILIQDSQLTGWVQGQNIRIENSQNRGNLNAVSDLSLSAVHGRISLANSSHITMKNVRVFGTEITRLSQARIENVDFVGENYDYQFTQLEIKDSSDLVFANIKREPSLSQQHSTDISVSIKGSKIQVSDILFDGGTNSVYSSSLPPGCYGTGTFSQTNFQGNDLVVQTSRFSFMPHTSQSCTTDVRSDILGTTVHLSNVDLSGAHIEGSQITLNGVKFGAAHEASQAQLKGNQVSLDSSVNFPLGSILSFENVHIEKLSVQGMSWALSALKDVQISDVHLISTHSDTNLTILNGTQIKNIRELTIVRQSLTFGDEKGNSVIDGAGLRYQVGMGGFWDRNTMQVKSQADLAEWAQ